MLIGPNVYTFEIMDPEMNRDLDGGDAAPAIEWEDVLVSGTKICRAKLLKIQVVGSGQNSLKKQSVFAK